MAQTIGKKRWVMILVAIVAAFLKFKYPELFENAGSGSVSQPTSANYEVYTNCRLVDYRNNDGDSFMVKFPDGRETEMRLYYVDAPESKLKTYRDGNSNKERIQAQGRALGGLTIDQTTQVGQDAKKRVAQLLSKPFTVYTKRQKVYGGPREYGFIAPEGGRTFLHERLVEEGLGRIHTSGAEMPDGTSVQDQEASLQRKESEAKREKRGAWAY